MNMSGCGLSGGIGGLMTCGAPVDRVTKWFKPKTLTRFPWELQC